MSPLSRRLVLVLSLTLLLGLSSFSSSPGAAVAVAAAGSSLLRSVPLPGALLYQLTAAAATNESDANPINSIVIQSNSSDDNITLALGNVGSTIYSLPYPAFSPITSQSVRGWTRQPCGTIVYIAAHPINQQLYFAAWDSDRLLGSVGYFLPNGSTSIHTPVNNATHEPLLYEYWALEFSPDGAYL